MFKRFSQAFKTFLGSSITSTGVWNWLQPGAWSKQDLIKQYTRVMYTIISAIAQEAAKIDFVVYRDADPDDIMVKNHDFVTMMKRPNPDQSQFQFLELHFTYLKLMGESYWYILRNAATKRPQEVYLLRPDLMTVFVPKDNNPLGLVGGYVMAKPSGQTITFDKDEVLHFKMPNPYNPYYGMGPIEAARSYIQTEQFASEWTKNSLYNSGRPSGIVNLKGIMDEKQFKELKNRFTLEYTGTKNAGKTLFIKSTDGMDYQKLGMELGELAMKDLKDMTRDDLMMMFRVSKTILGISEGVTLNNARDSRILFKESLILSEWDRLTDHITAFLLPVYGDKNLILKYKQPDLQTYTDKVSEWTNGFNKWLTRNEIRKERGLKDIPGGNVIREPIGLVPIIDDKPREPRPTPPPGDNTPKEDPNNPGYDMNGNPMPKPPKKPEENTPPPKPGDKTPTEQKPNAEKPKALGKAVIKSPMCRMADETKADCVKRKIPEIMKDDPSISQDQAIAMAESMCSKPCKKKDLMSKKDLFSQQLFDLQDSFIPVYKKEIDNEFARQEREILARHSEKSVTKNLDWLFDVQVAKSKLVGRLVPLGLQLMIDAARLALDMANDDTTEFQADDDVMNYIHDRVSRLADAMNDTTIALLQDSISEGMKNGENLSKLTDRVREIYDQATEVRAERIARTESLAASNEGTQEAYRQSPMVIAKEWSASPDCCDYCAQFDGLVVGLEENFATQGQNIPGEGDDEMSVDYEDVEHPPLHPNCRCALLPVASE